MNKEQRAYRKDLEILGDKLGCTADEAHDFVCTLPYSTIPTTDDAHSVVDWFVSHGWSPQTNNEEEEE